MIENPLNVLQHGSTVHSDASSEGFPSVGGGELLADADDAGTCPQGKSRENLFEKQF